MSVIRARGLRKNFGAKKALDGIDFEIASGRIVGLVGPNGAGKTTALNAIVGLMAYEGELEVLGRNPWTERDKLMRDVCFIADVAVLPRWIRTSQLLDYAGVVQPGFDRERADSLLSTTGIAYGDKVRELSKGMVAQLHLAIALSIDAKLLVLDEPTLGLDPLFRKQFYDTLLNDYFERNRTIVISTHEIEELQHIFTDVIFMDRGRIALACSVDDIGSRFVEASVAPGDLNAARSLHPMHERQKLGRTEMIFDGVERDRLTELGELRTPAIPDLFVAAIESTRTGHNGGAG
jgi:ABC-2 type transport system ATP-binding protein